MYKLITLILTLALVGCATTSTSSQSSPSLSAASSEFVTTSGGGFLLKSGKPMYAMTYTVIKEIPSGVKLRVSFENPVDQNTPLVTEVIPEGERILVRSEPLSAIENRKNYKVIAELVKDNQVVSNHVQYVRFDMPDDVLELMGVTTL